MRSPVVPGPHINRVASHWLADSGIVLKLVNSSVAKTGVKTVAAQYLMYGLTVARPDISLKKPPVSFEPQ